MKKFLILVAGAALIGFVISGHKAEEAAKADESRPTLADASAEAEITTTAVPLKAEAKLPPHPARTSEPRPTQSGSKEPETQSDPVAAAPAPGKVAPPGPSRASAGRTAAVRRPAAARTEPTQSDLSSLQRAEVLIKEGKRLEARKLLSDLYRSAELPVRIVACKLLDRINKDLVFDPGCLEGAKVHVVKRGEVLATIAKKYRVNWRMIARLNGIERPELIRENQELKIITGKPQILIDKSDFRLALFIDGHFIKEYRIGHGKNGKTPAGTFVIDQMDIRPPWNPPGGGVIRYGEEGYLIGERWMGFKNRPGANGLGIHGTDDPQSIGTLYSNGCIRMLNKDVIELFDFTVLAAKVEIVE